jgi:NADH-quinone oxidoreductase subunit L
MAGPTPVSALIHAATMVTAGVYMVARMHALYVLAPAAMAVVALVGAATALYAAIIGFAQNDMKKVLAYSTISQLGFMFAGVGTGNFAGGIFHLYTHAFFKAGLFLCAGSVMHAMGGLGDITKMGGLRRLLPWTHGVFLVCWLAICGVPVFSGFFSKDAIVAGAFATHAFGENLAWVGPVVGVLLLLAALGTAFYMSRLYFLVFTGEQRADAETRAHIHESPAIMVGPLVILAAGALVGGLVGVPGGLVDHPEWNLIGHWLAPAVGAELHVPHETEILFMGISTILAIVGIVVARAFYGGGYREPAEKFADRFPGLVQLVRDKFRVDELYGAVIIRPLRMLARGLYLVLDRLLIDQVLVNGVGGLVYLLGRLARSLQAGDGQRYLAAFAIGAAGLIWAATRPVWFPELKVLKSGNTVTVDVRRGIKTSQRQLSYAFDFNDDDDDDAPQRTGSSPQARYTYDRPGKYKIRVRVTDPRWHVSEDITHTVDLTAGAGGGTP